ncbi:PD-(D/E)XK nuclease family protein [Membranihabitans maritimus]|uniref:PD-(D/E)XK nuclease family protein n=1 Tax=Membranihabitans maritimus TaxID=2904244 RepID=UPI001F4415D8|nr:PD-(D/E)XK nuclease family protein [Membranihabitans maritimus]
MSFLEKTATHIWNVYNRDIDQQLFLFPTRRSMLFFNRELVKKAGKPIWIPDGYTLDEWIGTASGLLSMDELTLIELLYQSALETKFTRGSFENFYPLGKVILDDFEDVDFSLQHPDDVFQTVSQVRNIEERENAVAGIWDTILSGETSELQEKFVFNWDHLLGVYKNFNRKLEERESGYRGMIYKNYLRSIRKNFQSNHQGIHCIGFSTLTPCQEAIFDILVAHADTHFYWNEHPILFSAFIEGGEFVKKGMEKYGQTLPRSSEPGKPKIEIIEAPSAVAQVKACGQILAGHSPSELSERMALVLPDPVIMESLMNSIPDEVKAVNISMGFPLIHSPAYSFLDWLIALWEEIGDSGNFIKHNQINKILSHYYSIQYVRSKKITLPSQDGIYVNLEALRALDPLFDELFSPEEKTELFFHKVKSLFERIVSEIEDAFQAEILYYAIDRLTRLEDVLLKLGTDISFGFLSRLITEYFLNASVPFRGEPMQGLQILGQLEMQNLSFTRLFLLGLNEGVWPAGHYQSMIPYSIRKHYQLPGQRENLVSQSYYFWSSVLNAEKVTLLYSSGEDIMGAKGVSRFIQQIKYGNLGIDVTVRSIGFTAGFRESKDKVIKKDAYILSKLRHFLVDNGLSSTSLVDYVECPFRFAYKHVLGIREDDTVDEELSARDFGLVFHAVLQKLYEPFVGRDSIDFNGLKNVPEDLVEHIYREHLQFSEKNRASDKGIHGLQMAIVIASVKKVIEADSGMQGMSILSLENRLETHIPIPEVGAIKLKGFIDRVDSVEGTVRVVDYKSGKTELATVHWEDLFGEKANKHTIQLLIYAYLLHKNEGYELMEACHYALKQEGLVKALNVDRNNTVISTDEFQRFEEKLIILLQQMLNPAIPFSQTENIMKCQYCEFKNLCERYEG